MSAFMLFAFLPLPTVYGNFLTLESESSVGIAITLVVLQRGHQSLVFEVVESLSFKAFPGF